MLRQLQRLLRIGIGIGINSIVTIIRSIERTAITRPGTARAIRTTSVKPSGLSTPTGIVTMRIAGPMTTAIKRDAKDSAAILRANAAASSIRSERYIDAL